MIINRIRNGDFRILHWLFLPRPLYFCQRLSHRRRRGVEDGSKGRRGNAESFSPNSRCLRFPASFYFWYYRTLGFVLTVGLLTTPVQLRVTTAVAQVTPGQSSSSGMVSGLNVLFVNPATGDDTKGDGTERSPFKTITQALRVAQPNSVILLSPGIYSRETGETFPLMMKSGVTIQGNPRTRGEGIVIQGGGTLANTAGSSQDITILGANQAGLTGVTVTNPNPQGYALWIESSSPIVVDNTFTGNTNGGISVKGNSAPTIRSNYFYDNGGDGIIISGALQAEVRENVFENNGSEISVAQNVAPQVIRERPAEGNAVGSNSQPETNNQVPEAIAPTSDNPPSDRTESNRISTAAEPVATQESNAEINAQSPLPSANTAQSETSLQIMSVRLRENESSVPTDRVNESATVSEPAASAPTVAVPQTATDSGSATPQPSDNALRTPTQTQSDRQPLASPAVESPGTAPQQPTEQGNESDRQVSANPPALAQPSPLVTPPQPPANAEPSATGISAASFPVPSLLSSQNSASASRVSSTPVTSSQTNAAGTPTPSPNASAASSPSQDTAATRTNVIEFNEPLTSQPAANETSRSSSAAFPQPQLPSQPQEATETEGIELAVPVPENSTPQALNPTPPASAQTPSSGNTSQGQTATPAATAPATPQNQRYRVLVEAKSEEQQQLVRSLVPGAFRTVFNGESMMQAGLFSTRESADEIVQLLTSNGLVASIEPMD